MPSIPGYPIIVAIHAVYSVACPGICQFINPVLAYFALETVCMERIIPSHYCLVVNCLLTYCTAICAISTDRRSIG